MDDKARQDLIKKLKNTPSEPCPENQAVFPKELPKPRPQPTPPPNPKILWDDPIDIFFGYSYMRAPDESVKNNNGLNGQFQINLKTKYVERGYSGPVEMIDPRMVRVPKWSIGIDSEFAAAFGSSTVGTSHSTLHRYLYLFGPQFNFISASQKTRLFTHALFGGVHDSGTTTVGSVSFSGSANAFAMGFGGGVDIALNRRLALRVAEFDYVPTRFGGSWQSNFQFSSGVVIKFPRKH